MSTAPVPQRDAVQVDNAKFTSFGISTALITPFCDDGSLSLPAAQKHVGRVLSAGAAGITLFGTTGEGASIGIKERKILLDGIIGTVADPDAVTVCICSCNLEEALSQAEQACQFGVRRLLVTPPYYFNGVSDDGVVMWYRHFISALKHYELDIILYNLPQVTQVELSIHLVRRLKDEFGGAIFGVKDSSGSWESASRLLAFDDLAVLIGDERLLAKAGPLGCAGAISGMANLFPGTLRDLILTGEDHSSVTALVTEVVRHPVTPLVKHLVGIHFDEPIWRNVRAPLLPSHPNNIDAMVGLVNNIMP